MICSPLPAKVCLYSNDCLYSKGSLYSLAACIRPNPQKICKYQSEPGICGSPARCFFLFFILLQFIP